MEWYYAILAERRGPVTPEQMAALVARGEVHDDTLVWRAGMPNWQPWVEVAPTAGLPPPPRDGGVEAGAPSGLDDETAAGPIDAEAFWAGVQTNGYVTSVSSCLGRAWDLYKRGFWPALVATCLVMLVQVAAGIVPFVGLAAAFVVNPQMNAGMHWYFLRRMRGEPSELGDVFAGFSRSFGQLALMVLWQLLIGLPLGIAMVVLLGGMGALSHASESATPVVGPLAALGVVVIGLALAVIMFRLLLAPIIIIDRGYAASDALKLSWRLMGKRFWTLLGLMLAMLLISFAGILALIIGLLLVAPLYPAAVSYAYEDAWRAARGLPPAP